MQKTKEKQRICGMAFKVYEIQIRGFSRIVSIVMALKIILWFIESSSFFQEKTSIWMTSNVSLLNAFFRPTYKMHRIWWLCCFSEAQMEVLKIVSVNRRYLNVYKIVVIVMNWFCIRSSLQILHDLLVGSLSEFKCRNAQGFTYGKWAKMWISFIALMRLISVGKSSLLIYRPIKSLTTPPFSFPELGRNIRCYCWHSKFFF